MRFIFSLAGLGFVVMGLLLIAISSKTNLTINYTAFTSAALGIGMVAIGCLVALLVEILNELKTLNKSK